MLKKPGLHPFKNDNLKNVESQEKGSHLKNEDPKYAHPIRKN